MLGAPVSWHSFSNSATLGSRRYNVPIVQMRTVRPRGVKPMILGHTAAEWQPQELRLDSLSNMYASFFFFFLHTFIYSTIFEPQVYIYIYSKI